MKIVVRKFKEDKSQAYREWGKTLSSEKLQEAKLSLKEENVLEEATALVNIKGEDYWIGVQFDNGEVLPANTSREVNLKHQKMNKECLGESAEVSVLYDIKAD